MQNTTTPQTSNRHTIPKHIKITVNSGRTYMSSPTEHLTSENLARCRVILNHEESLLKMPFGDIKCVIQRQGSVMDIGFGYKNAVLLGCRVASQCPNHEFWDELVDSCSLLQKMNAIIGYSGNTLKAPEHSPWIAIVAHSGIAILKGPERLRSLFVMNDLAIAFMIDSATNSGANTSASGR